MFSSRVVRPDPPSQLQHLGNLSLCHSLWWCNRLKACTETEFEKHCCSSSIVFLQLRRSQVLQNDVCETELSVLVISNRRHGELAYFKGSFLLVSAAVQVTLSQEIPLESKTTKLSILQVHLLLLLFFSEGKLPLFSIFCLTCKKWEEGVGRGRLRVLRFILSPGFSKTGTTGSHWLSWARTVFPSSSQSPPPLRENLCTLSPRHSVFQSIKQIVLQDVL